MKLKKTFCYKGELPILAVACLFFWQHLIEKWKDCFCYFNGTRELYFFVKYLIIFAKALVFFWGLNFGQKLYFIYIQHFCFGRNVWGGWASFIVSLLLLGALAALVEQVCNSFHLSLIHIWRCRRYSLCRSRCSPYH